MSSADWGTFLHKYILDNGDIVRNRRVLDLGCGCGAGAIAAAKMVAKYIVGNDIDPYAIAATKINMKMNDVVLETNMANRIGAKLKEFDTILVGDMFYDEKFAEKLFNWLYNLSAEGKTVLLGDPGRHGLTQRRRRQMSPLATYTLTPTSCQENSGFTHATVWTISKK